MTLERCFSNRKRVQVCRTVAGGAVAPIRALRRLEPQQGSHFGTCVHGSRPGGRAEERMKPNRTGSVNIKSTGERPRFSALNSAA